MNILDYYYFSKESQPFWLSIILGLRTIVQWLLQKNLRNWNVNDSLQFLDFWNAIIKLPSFGP